MTIELSTLENGLRVVSQRMEHIETVSLGLWVGAGSRFEEEREHGMAHLLEHLAFKGTKRRSARQIAEEIESVGGEINAATSLETTAYFARMLRPELPLGVELLSDILINPTFDGAELDREKNVIIQEIAASRDNPDDVIYDLVQEFAFPNQALGRPILGTEESVRAILADDLRAFRNQHYGADGMVFAAAGPLDHGELVRMAGDHFGDIGRRMEASHQQPVYRSGVCCSPLRFEQSHLLIAYQGPSYSSPDYYPVQVLAMILGGGMSSRLFQEVREVRGLCYSIYAFCWGISDTGLLGIHAASAAEQVDELLDVVAGEIARCCEQPPAATELKRAKAQFKANLLMSLESSGAQAAQLARQTLAFGAPLEISEIIAKIDAVSGDAVQSTAKKVFDGTKPTIASVGPQDLRVADQAWVRRLSPAADLAAE